MAAEPTAATCHFGLVVDHCSVHQGRYEHANATLTLAAGQPSLPRSFQLDVFPGKWRHHAKARPGVADMPTVSVLQSAAVPPCAATPLTVPVFLVGAMWLRNFYHALLDFSFSLFATVRAALGYPFRSAFSVVLVNVRGPHARAPARVREPWEPDGSLSAWAPHLKWLEAGDELCASAASPLNVGLLDSVSLRPLLLPERGSRAAHDAPRSRDALRDYRHFLLGHLLPHGGSSPSEPERRALLVRRLGSRQLQNGAAVLRELRAALPGWAVEQVDFGAAALRPLRAQAAAVRGARLLVGVHGAALSNSIFLRPAAGRAASLVQLVPSCFPRSYQSIGGLHWAVAALGGAPLLARCRCACARAPPEHNDLLEDCAAEQPARLAARVARILLGGAGDASAEDARTPGSTEEEGGVVNVTRGVGERRPCQRLDPRPSIP